MMAVSYGNVYVAQVAMGATRPKRLGASPRRSRIRDPR